MPADTPLFTRALPDADATAAFAISLGALLRAGDVLLLEGPIGAGKTHFARALIQDRLSRLGRNEDVPSPTFTLVQVYDAEPEIWHADLYRLGHPDEAIELGLEEAFDTAICLIEWPERLGPLAPPEALRLSFTQTEGGAARRVSGFGPATWAARLAALESATND